MLGGSCLCGAVTFDVLGPLRPVLACHCSQCRKTSGHYWAATSVPDDALDITRRDGLRWYRASDRARRGFCSHCGASLFWKPDGQGRTAIAAGALNRDTGLKTVAHVFVADKGDYYQITDGLPQHETYSGEENA